MAILVIHEALLVISVHGVLCAAVNADGCGVTQWCSVRQEPSRRSGLSVRRRRQCLTGRNTHHHRNRIGCPASQGQP